MQPHIKQNENGTSVLTSNETAQSDEVTNMDLHADTISLFMLQSNKTHKYK